MILLIAAEGFSCALRPAPPPATAIDSDLRNDLRSDLAALPEDPAAIETLARDYFEEGDIVTADAILAAALQKNLSRSWKAEFRTLRQTIRKTQFQRACPLELRVVEPPGSFSLGDDLTAEFEVINRSAAPLTIPSRGSFWWLPFADSRQSLIQIRVALTDVTIDGVISGGSWNEIISFDGSLTIQPGSSASFSLDLYPVSRKSLIYRRIAIDGELIPGGLETEEFDYGMMRFRFDRGIFHFFDDPAPGLARSTLGELERALEMRVAPEILRNAVLLGEDELWIGVDRLVSALPSLPIQSCGMALAALRIITEQNLGSDFHRWINWWQEARPGLLPGETPIPGKTPTDPAVSAAPVPIGGCLLAALPLFPVVSPDSKDRLRSPYFGRRQKAIGSLAEQGSDDRERLETLLRDENALVRSGAAAVLAKLDGSAAWKTLSAALPLERSRAVRQTMVQALARLGAPLPDLPESWQAGDREILLELYRDRRLAQAMESVMHGGMVPGFYDGQFAHFWAIAPDMTRRLVAIAHDPDRQYITRILAIMSLAEKPYPALEEDLKALIIPASSEIKREWYSFNDMIREDAITDEMVGESRALKLSGYARYALAKAGEDRYVLAKISAMMEWIRTNRAVIDEDGMFDGIVGSRLQLKQEFGRYLFFDIGYEYQQLDDFENAESWYLRLIDRFPESNARANTHYNLACLCSLQNRLDESIHHLKQAMEKGFFDFAWMDEDRDLDNVRAHPDFAVLKENLLSSDGEIGDDVGEGD